MRDDFRNCTFANHAVTRFIERFEPAMSRSQAKRTLRYISRNLPYRVVRRAKKGRARLAWAVFGEQYVFLIRYADQIVVTCWPLDWPSRFPDTGGTFDDYDNRLHRSRTDDGGSGV